MTNKNERQQGDDLRSSGTSYQALLDLEQVVVPESLRANSLKYMGSANLSVDRYLAREFHELEKQKVWPKVWQMVCREEEIPNVGDHIVYDITDYSFIIVRNAENEIKSFYNSCLHRGRSLCDKNGTAKYFRCPYHAFTWGLDGQAKFIPSGWDFGHFTEGNSSLDQTKVDTWGGFVFINMDDNCMPLAEYLDVLPEHFERWPLAQYYKGAHVKRVVRANWKIAQEAFQESFHVIATHPQIMTFTADENSQYDSFGAHINRTMTASAVMSPHIKNKLSEGEIVAELLSLGARNKNATDSFDLPVGMTAREFMANLTRDNVAKITGKDQSHYTASECIDSILYNVFPNFAPWAGLNSNIVYRFRPNGDDHTSCIMEAMLLMRYDESGPRPAPCDVHELEEHEDFSSAQELGGLGAVFDQDMANIPSIMKGMKAGKRREVVLGNYQEGRIRHIHQTLDKYINA